METKKISVNDFDNICRVCLSFNANIILIKNSLVNQIIEACSCVQMYNEDSLPKHICKSCFDRFEDYWKFKQIIIKSTTILHAVLTKSLDRDQSKESIDLKNDNTADVDGQKSMILGQPSDDIEDGNDVQTETFPQVPFSAGTAERSMKSEVVQYFCDKCNSGKVFHELRTLSIHMQRIHNVQCVICLKKLYHKLHFDLHMRSHTEKLHKCEKCYKSFSYRYLLNNHQSVHINERLHSCNSCEKMFKGSFYLKRHKKRCHSVSQREICPICDKEIVHAYMKRHLIRHSNRKVYKCNDCNREYCYRKLLETHMKSVHQRHMQRVYKYLCTICGKRVLSPKDLKAHMRVHSGEKPYQCTTCEKRYKTSSTLIEHVRATHTLERPHVCPICTKKFYRKSILKNHMQTHSTDRPHVCQVCGSAFGYKAVLKKHMSVHL